MQLHERLMDLIGHDVSLYTQLEGKAGGISSGVVKEVGPDFLILGSRDGHSDSWVRMEAVTTIVHDASCPRCAQNPAA